ncbi:RHS repeat-associated core domain-containing protein [Flagellimonas sp. S3867]|uniref:Ig-like domain-containing protein n=1 Tax=Flagellimonas sp. S3867 TaxID=2768063 RepID=UPI001CC246FA|nr:RHS repeat-associated core domain-containing protein [Flagellimonas sp. S3867]
MKILKTIIKNGIFPLFFLAVSGLQAQFAIGGQSSTDVGDTETFNISNNGGGTIINTQWSVVTLSHTIVSGQGSTTANIKFNSVGSGQVKATVLNSSFNSSYLTKPFTVNGTVVGQVSITSGPTSRCKGAGTSDYNASATNANSYSWSITPASAGTINSSGTVTWDSNYVGTATVSVTAHGDNNSSTNASRPVTVNGPDLYVPDEVQNSCSNPSSAIIHANSSNITPGDPLMQHRLYTAASGGSPQFGTPMGGASYITEFTVTQAGDYWISALYDGCETSREKVTVTFKSNTTPTLTLENMSGDQCGSSASFVLRAIGGVSGNGLIWYDAQSGGNQLATGSTYTPTITTTGVTSFWVGGTLQSPLGCTFTIARERIDVTLNATPLEATGTNPPARTCTGSFTLNASPGTNGNAIRWYDAPTGGNEVGTGTSFTAQSISTTTSYYAETYHTTAGCVSATRKEFVMEVITSEFPLVVTATGNDCSNPTQATISAYSGGYLTSDPLMEHRLYTVATGGTAQTNGTPNGFATDFTVISEGDYWVSAFYNGCETPREQVTVSFTSNAPPTLTLSNMNGAQCSPNASFTLRAIGGGSGSVYNWYDEESGGTLLHTGDTYTPTLDYSDTNNGLKSYYVRGTLESALGCNFPITGINEVQVTVNPEVGIASGEDPFAREGAGTFTLNAEPGTDADGIYWYDAPTGGTYLGEGTEFVTQSISTSQFFYAESFNSVSTCRSSERIAIEAIVLPATWYTDSDLDGFGDPSSVGVQSYTSPFTGAVTNNSDYCPNTYSTTNNGCPNDFENLNWITAKAYDIDGTLKASSKSYYNDLGKLEQTQTVDIEENRTWASQIVFDSHGRSAVQSLSAPNGLSGTFQFQPDFMQNNLDQTYSLADFSNTSQDPTIVGQSINTLGWYYSNSNDDDFYPGNDYQDITDRPFSRTIYSTLNPGGVLKAVGGNKVDMDGDGTVDSWPQNYTFTMPATAELTLSVAFGDNAYQNVITTKTVSRDVHGNENVVFTDSEGKVLAAARSGGASISNYMNHFIGEQGYVDIHIPQGLAGLTSSNGGALQVFDMITETLYTGTLGTLPSGFYRIAVTDPDNYDAENNPISVGYRVNYYDYSLNEYDKADRLVKSYQPLGTTKAAKPVTTYDYNSLGQLTHTDSPDEGEAWFKYREDGQIRFSQNSKQKDPNEDDNFADAEFSYTEYDTFGRPIESGVLVSTGFDAADPDGALPAGTKKEQQFTTYDIADDAALATALGSRSGDYPSQSFVAGNVAHTANDISETWYAYDIYGRVKWLVQNIQGLGAKTMDYTYHPTTGLVTQVIFQKGVTGEQFVHRYGYDVKDRLSTVETSSDGGTTYTLQAEYSYYETGGLKRVDLANGAQGVDYVYNLAGQLKSINHPGLNATDDPGGDANDLFGMQLDYHNNDFERGLPNIGQTTYGTDQFNGNIKGVRWSNGYNTGATEYVYSYDRNNWLTAADFNPSNQTGSLPETLPLSGNITGDQPSAGSITVTADATITGPSTLRIDPSGAGFSAGDYDVTNITYDANGNIQSLKRNKGSQDGDNAMDDLSYTYKTTPQDGPNQLLQVTDAEGDVTGANDDIGTQAANNYSYNKIGQLTRNNAEDIDYFYNASGLVTEVWQAGQPAVKFFYNDRNHRTKKETYTSGTLQYTTHYVRNVAGLTMAIYNDFGGSVALKEQAVYGSGRIGVAYASSSAVENRDYVYELTDHLGNVRAVFTKSGSSANGESYTDYYPFGMQMPARGLLGPEGYRYAFQGQEKDTETGKEAFELRLWDSRIGRWLTTDPAGQYYSPYMGMGNNPISRIDPDGGQDCECKDKKPPKFDYWGRFMALFFGKHKLSDVKEQFDSGNVTRATEMLNSNHATMDLANENIKLATEIITTIEPTGLTALAYGLSDGEYNFDDGINTFSIVPFGKGLRFLKYANNSEEYVFIYKAYKETGIYYGQTIDMAKRYPKSVRDDINPEELLRVPKRIADAVEQQLISIHGTTKYGNGLSSNKRLQMSLKRQIKNNVLMQEALDYLDAKLGDTWVLDVMN